MTTRRVLILGMLMTGHAMAQTKPAAKGMDALVADAMAEPELVAADIGRLVSLRAAGGAEGGDAMTPPDLPAGTPLLMVAPRGGYASALAVARGPKLNGLKASVSPLQGPGGAIPPASVRIRWLTGPAFATVFSEQPAGGPVQPVLLTVKAPESQAPGTYAGRLSVNGPDFSGALDVKLEVAAWQVPPPKDWPMLTGFVHSPDTIALWYKVEPWSDQHLKLMEPSLELLKDLGSESCYLYLISEANYYERYSIVRWKGYTPGVARVNKSLGEVRDTITVDVVTPDIVGVDADLDGVSDTITVNTATPDFVCVDKYLDLYQKVCGIPRKVTLHVWEGNRQPHYNAANSVRVTCDTGGKLRTFKAPYYDTPQALAFWKPVFDGIRDRVAKRGWKDTEILLGLPFDCHPSEEAIDFFKKAAPGWRWRVFTHGFNVNLPQADGTLFFPCGAEVGWIEGTGPMGYGQMVGKHPGLIRSAQMKRNYPFTIACRQHIEPPGRIQSWMWRDAPASAVRSGNQGLSQVGLDHWDFDFEKYKPKPPNLKTSSLIQIGWGGFNPRHRLANSITAPGPNGAEPTLFYELLREGLQAAAALVLARDTPGGNEFDAFMKARLDHFLTWRPQNAPPPDPAVTSQGKWNAAVRSLYQSAASAPKTAATLP